jgi:hypothetical protein
MTDKLIEAVARAIYSSHSMEYDHPSGWSIELESARAALAAIEASGTHVVVPVEPTFAMNKAGKGNMPVEYDLRTMLSSREPEFPSAQRLVAVGFEHPNKQAKPASVYAAMIAARPQVLP